MCVQWLENLNPNSFSCWQFFQHDGANSPSNNRNDVRLNQHQMTKTIKLHNSHAKQVLPHRHDQEKWTEAKINEKDLIHVCKSQGTKR